MLVFILPPPAKVRLYMCITAATTKDLSCYRGFKCFNEALLSTFGWFPIAHDVCTVLVATPLYPSTCSQFPGSEVSWTHCCLLYHGDPRLPATASPPAGHRTPHNVPYEWLSVAGSTGRFKDAP